MGLALAAQHDVEAVGQAIHGVGAAHVQARDQALYRVRVGDGLDDRAQRDQRVAFEIQLGDQARGDRRATDGEMDMRRAPVIGAVAPRVGAGLDGAEL